MRTESCLCRNLRSALGAATLVGLFVPTNFGGGIGQAVERGTLSSRRLAYEADERIAGHDEGEEE